MPHKPLSLLTQTLDDALRAKLCNRVTPGGVRLEDVIRSGLCHPDSYVGVYAPDAQSYGVFRELFDPILQNFRAPARPQREDLACLNPAAIVSTRIRVARNLADHAFTAGMSRQERLCVEAKIVRACDALAPHFPGWIRELTGMPSGRLDSMVLRRMAFGPHDKYMAAAQIHADWPIGRSVFNTRKKQLSIWINEEDHLRVSVVMPGACIGVCAELMAQVMSSLAKYLDFCVDTQLGYLTSCPSNVGSAMRASYMVSTRVDATREPHLARLESAGRIQIRGSAGENSGHSGGLMDVGFRNRVGISAEHMLQDMEMLVATH
ncbi:MAG: hypothetical protein CFE43_08730 [Burkholderiales bacterium PBB3]|nr:MAG: hypothetical protein CFE43_08730 [Burkholderiales bacterium PBB3]